MAVYGSGLNAGWLAGLRGSCGTFGLRTEFSGTTFARWRRMQRAGCGLAAATAPYITSRPTTLTRLRLQMRGDPSQSGRCTRMPKAQYGWALSAEVYCASAMVISQGTLPQT